MEESQARLSELPSDVVVVGIMQFLDSKSVACLSRTSLQLRDYVKAANEHAGQQVPHLRKELNALISNSGITGIQMPAGPFRNSIEQLRALETLEKNLPTAIEVLKNNDIQDINSRNEYGYPRLNQAAFEGNIELSKALIAAGADVNAKNKGCTPLHYASRGGHTEIVEILRAAQPRQTSYFSTCTIM